MENDPITDYSQTQRVVLLIDLNPLLHLRNPNHFLTSILSSAKILLSFSPLSSSLFAFKFFFSSLSLLLSSSKLRSFVPNSTLSLSFDHPIAAFESLSQTLSSLPSSCNEESALSSPRASCLVASMRQLVHDYAWDPVIQGPVTGTLLNSGSVLVRSNLVVLFSPIPASLKYLSELLDVGIDDDCLGDVSSFCERFCGFFASVNDAFVSRDIQFSWVNVRVDDDYDKFEIDESELRSEFFESGIRNLGWGFCSSDSIVLGSALVPFGLIYPKIGISPNGLSCNDCSKKLHVQLSLEILDVAQKPLECKCCDLELVDLKLSPVNRSDNGVFCIPEIMNTHKGRNELKEKLWGSFGGGVSKLQVKALHRNNDFKKLKGHLSDPILVREVSEKPRKDKKEGSDDFFADKVLEVIAREWADFVPSKSAPIYQILSSFLYREGYWALVSLSNESRDSLLGILKPLTVCSALLFITNDEVYNDEFYPSKKVPEIDGADVALVSTKVKDVSSQPSKHSDKDEKNTRRKRNLKLVQDHTWSSFCAAAFEHFEFELEEVYFARGCNNSKKLRFLKCWMKQIKKSSCSGIVLEQKTKPQQEIQKDIGDRLTNSCQESEQPISSASAQENSLTGDSRIRDEAAADFPPETSENFFGNLSKRIQQGLESEAVDLGALAQRLVNSSIHWLNKKCDTETTSKSQIPDATSQDTTSLLGAKLLNLLLRDPKDLIAKGRSNDPSSQASQGSASEKIILFRMEILQSEVGENIGESMTQKFVKQICLLLETIQCHLEGGFFGDWSLDNYVGKIIKARYSDTLKDVVHKIYTKMDLLLFADEDELPNRLLNSEDSTQSLREKPEKVDMGENIRSSEPISAEDESFQELENDNGMTQEKHARKLLEAQERRERSRKFASFTSWVPDLQRVWAPKQQKAMKPKSDRRRKLSKRKSRAEEINDRVCETPMTEKKRSNSGRSYDDDEDYQRDKDYSSQSRASVCASVSKALFQDDR
ncbi:hypothetical protein L484_000762 [Morus notabilis]|uniref:Treslin N-terminal domain-containing protein n=1 Tax=Morus notabilis TaxID=981085 RepID=W9RGA1_9ROSA|nr:hypothetical protein L484_011482 [Morus notabilis]EXC37465.1 hypothetical protein L484_000762 [Morus notabilis]